MIKARTTDRLRLSNFTANETPRWFDSTNPRWLRAEIPVSFFVVLALLILPHAAKAQEFEINPSCMHAYTYARCFVQNKQPREIQCEVQINGWTTERQPVRSKSIVLVYPHNSQFAELIVPNGNLERVSAVAICNPR